MLPQLDPVTCKIMCEHRESFKEFLILSFIMPWSGNSLCFQKFLRLSVHLNLG